MAPRRAKSRIGAILSESAQALDLDRAQPAMGPRREGSKPQWTEACALQLAHRMTDRLTHPPYLAVASFADG